MTVFVDANIPMYAGGRASPYKDRCKDILSWIAVDRLDAATDAEVFQEILYRYHHIKRTDVGSEVFNNLRTVIERVLPISGDCVFLAEELGRTYADVKPRDLLHVAVMVRNGIRTIVSVDQDFDRISEVDRLDPLTMTEPPLVEVAP